MKLTSVRARLTLWNVGVMAFVLTAFAAAVSCSVHATLGRSIDQDLRHNAHHAAERVSHLDLSQIEGLTRSAQHGRRDDHPSAEPPPARNGSHDTRVDWRRPRIFDTQGKSLFFGPPDQRPWDVSAFRNAVRGAETFSTVKIDNESVRIISEPVWREGHVEAVVQMAHPLSELRHLLQEMGKTLLALVPLALLVAGLGGAFLTSRALRPVRHVTEAASQIGERDLSLRLPVSGNDEFSVLARTFNGMIGRLEEAFTRLGNAFEQQRRFTGDASHELRTPLTTIKAETSLALSGNRSPEEYRRALQAADHAADVMNRIVQDLLLLARTDGGQMGLDLRPVRVIDLLRRVLETAPGRTDGPPVILDIPDPSIAVMGDPHHLSRLFVNLIDNARRHTPASGRITAAARASGRSIIIHIVDTGEGIAPEHLGHVFERFYRVDAARSRAHGGAGLGLAICQSIVQAHHGTLDLQSELGQGTTVTVTLPRSA